MTIDRDDEGGDTPKGKSGAFSAFGISDLMKKAVVAAVGAAFMTEESVRGYVAESKLPRDIAKYMIQNAAQAKEQFFGYLAKEITALAKKSDIRAIAEKFLQEHTIEIEAKIRFKANAPPEVSVGTARTVAIAASGSAGTSVPGAPAAAPSGSAGPAMTATGPVQSAENFETPSATQGDAVRQEKVN